MQTQEITQNVSETKTSTLADFGLRVEERMTTPSRIGKKPRPVWVAVGNTYGLEEFFRTIKGKKFRGMWSFFDDPSDEILEELVKNGRKSFAEQFEYTVGRKEAKADRYESYSENAQARAEGYHKCVDNILSFIPAGQPILVGHHSEKRHRRDIERMDNNMRKSVEESKKSEYFSYQSNSLRHDAHKMTYSRKFIGNRIKDAQKEISKLNRYSDLIQDNEVKARYTDRINQAQEKLEFWQSQLKKAEQNLLEEGQLAPSPETISIGDQIYYIGDWLPVVRVNKKSVTVSHWHGTPQSKYIVPYTKFLKFRKAEKQ